jgi:hypothetical protein
MTNNEGYRLRFGFAHGVRGLLPTVSTVQEFVRNLVDKDGEVFGSRKIRQKRNPASRGHSSRWSNSAIVFQYDTLIGYELF